MHRFFGRLAAAFFVFVASESLAPAWDDGGHEIVATLACERLNPRARQAVADFARQISAPGAPYDSITMACWMDDLRKPDVPLPEHGLFFTWHYIDLGVELGDPVPSFQPGDDNEFHGNVVQALKRALVVLQGGGDPYIKTKAMACAMTMHLVGDIHQPLHAATHYFRTAGGWLHHDAGGNKEYVVNGPEGDREFSLHNFWDSAWRASFNEATGRVAIDRRYQEYGGHDSGAVRALAQELSRQPLPGGISLRTDFDGWARESNRIAQDFVYREITATENKKYCRLSSGYVARANALARERLAVAAARLAVLLNETLGAAAPVRPPPAWPAGPAGRDYETGY